MKFKRCLFLLTLLFSINSYAVEKTKIRLAVLVFGTVNWELEALKNNHLLDNVDFELEIRTVANPQAGKIALQSGAVDMIVSDWIWVSRMRNSGMGFSFYPYSTTSGALMVSAKSSIKSLEDLAGKKLAIAGGELDKNWLLLQALGQKKNLNLSKNITPVYGAPPLLNQQLLKGRVDAVMNYWHFAARLEAQGYQQLFNGKTILTELGIKETLPTLGYVFKQSWAEKHKSAIKQFLTATQKAKATLCTQDKAWQAIIPLTKTKDVSTQNKLRESYCAGQVKAWGDKEKQAAEQVYQLLRTVSDNKLTGKAERLSSGTFWTLD